MAATIGLVQYDIKRVLAYSTVSQLGYMFLAMGVGAYATAHGWTHIGLAAFAAGAFHLMTHAFFKALLFLGSGSVIHAMAGEQDMRRMGDLKRYMPVTYMTMMIGTLAIAGIFPFAGLFSKDEILFRTFLTNKIIWSVRGGHGADDRVLHVPADVDDVLRQLPRTRVGAHDAGGGARGSRMACRIPPIRTRTARRTRRSTTCRMARPTITGRPTTPRTGTATGRGTGRTSRRRR